MSDANTKWEKVTNPKNARGRNEKPTVKGDSVMRPLDDVSNTKNLQSRQAGKSAPKKKPKKPVEDKFKFKTIEEALSSEAIVDLDKQIDFLKENRNNQVVMVCKQLAPMLDDQLRCPDESVTQVGREFNFPLCKAGKKSQSVLIKLFSNELPEDMVSHMYQTYINSMLDNLSKDQPVWGHKICIQAIAHAHPNLCTNDLEKYTEKIKLMQNVPKRCLSLLWALGQCGINDASCGAKIWLELMLPALGMKNMAPYCMSYIETILERAKGKTINVQPEQFLQISAWTFDSVHKIPSKSTAIRDRVKDVYPSFRSMALQNNANKRQLFAKIMEGQAEESPALCRELTKLAVDCLQSDAHCFSVWRESYTRSLYRTKLILVHVEDNWEQVVGKMPRTSFAETIRAFKNTNADAAGKSDPLTSRAEFHDVRTLCDKMNERLTVSRGQPVARSRRIFLTLGVVLLALCLAYVAYDVKQNGGVWAKSRTHEFLRAKGVLAVMSHVSRKLLTAYDVTERFLSKNVPLYWSGFRDAMSPYVALVSEKLSLFVAHLWQVSTPARAWLYSVAMQCGEYLQDLGHLTLQGLDKVIEVTWPVVVWVKDGLVDLYQGIFDLASGETTWAEAYDASVASLTSLAQRSATLAKTAAHVITSYVVPETP